MPCHPGSAARPAESACCCLVAGLPLGCLRSCLWIGPQACVSRSWGPAVCSSVTLKLCFNGLSQCFAWPPHRYPCFISMRSSCSVISRYPLSRVFCPLVLIFCDWGFDTCKVTVSLLGCWQLRFDAFLFPGSPGATLDKVCSMTHCCDTSFFLRATKKALGFCFELDCCLPASWRSLFVEWSQSGYGCPQVDTLVLGPGLPTTGFYLILRLLRNVVNLQV